MKIKTITEVVYSIKKFIKLQPVDQMIGLINALVI